MKYIGMALDAGDRLPDALWALLIILPTLAGMAVLGFAMYFALGFAMAVLG
jgi:hypothetical protein